MQPIEPPWPSAIRARARRCRKSLQALCRELVDISPDAPDIARDPTLSERISTWPYDLDAAAVLAAVDRLVDALDDIIDD